MITINGRTFAANATEFTDSLFSPGGTCSGYYKRDGRGGLHLMDHNGNRIGGVRCDGLLYRCSKPAGSKRYFYQPAAPELVGGLDAPYRSTADDAAAALRTVYADWSGAITMTTIAKRPYQAITTHVLRPTDTKPTRVKATSASGKNATTAWDHALDAFENHAAAARELIDRMQWDGHWEAGASAKGYVFVRVQEAAPFQEAVRELENLTAFAVGRMEPRQGNPYCKPSVQRALKYIAASYGVTDWLSVPLPRDDYRD